MNRIILSVLLGTLGSSMLASVAQAQSTTWIGKAPFCTAQPSDCKAKGMKYVRSHASGDGETCLTGIKVLCSSGPALLAQRPCPYNAKKISTSLVCSCTASQTKIGSIWGTGDYTADSSLCRAAVHAGIIRASGGNIRITKKPGRSSYKGSSANGVTTNKWRAYPSSFRISK